MGLSTVAGTQDLLSGMPSIDFIVPLMATHCLFDGKLYSLNDFIINSDFFSLFSKMSWSTLSKVFAKYK